MGLGKTPEAIAIANAWGARRVLVVCPRSLFETWRREIARWDNGADSAAISNNPLDKFGEISEKITGRWFIVNHDIFRQAKYADAVRAMRTDLIIVDEAHHMRNLKSAAKARGLRDFLFNATEVVIGGNKYPVKIILMTGSPVVNEASDLFPHLHIADPEEFPTLAGFERKHCQMGGYGNARSIGFWDPGFIQSKIAQFGVQRKKKDVASLIDMIYPIVIKNFKLVRGIWVPPHYFAKNIM